MYPMAAWFWAIWSQGGFEASLSGTNRMQGGNMEVYELKLGGSAASAQNVIDLATVEAVVCASWEDRLPGELVVQAQPTLMRYLNLAGALTAAVVSELPEQFRLVMKQLRAEDAVLLSEVTAGLAALHEALPECWSDECTTVHDARMEAMT
jgi:hypothetical protein